MKKFLKMNNFFTRAGVSFWLLNMLILALVITVSVKPAVPADPLTLNLTGQMVITEVKDGKEVTKLMPLTEEVKPGDVIQYDIEGKNNSDKPLLEVKAVGKIPPETSYIDASAKCDVKADVEVSIDKGVTFAKPPIKIKVKKEDGTEVEKVVPPEQYTDLRFVVKEIGAEKTFTGTYRVKVK